MNHAFYSMIPPTLARQLSEQRPFYRTPVSKSVKTMKILNLCASRLAVLVSVLVAGGLLLPVVASATPISFYNNTSTPLETSRFTVGCGSATGDCAGLLVALSSDSSVAWSSSTGLMLEGPGRAKPAEEMDFVNESLGTVFSANSGHIKPDDKHSSKFQLDAEYFLIKVGNGPTGRDYALLHNLGGSLNLWFTQTGQAGGLSHYITFGTAQTPQIPQIPVPEPGTLGMFGLGALLAGLFLGTRRRFS